MTNIKQLKFVSGPWSDSHGRRRKPLVFIPIIGQILTDGLCILNVYFWNWPPHVAAIFEALTPGLFGARSMFWIGVITFISDNNPNELRTLKYGIINAIYTVSTLIGTGLAGFINVWLGFYGSFIISILFNLFGIMIVLNLIQENSTEYDKNVVWLKPKYFYRGYMNIFKKTTKYYTITIIALLLCQAVLVGRIGGKFIIHNLISINVIVNSIDKIRLGPDVNIHVSLHYQFDSIVCTVHNVNVNDKKILITF